MKINSKELIEQLLKDGMAFNDSIEKEFLSLDEETLKSRPEKHSWNILECIEHLNLTYDYYNPQIKKSIIKSKKDNNTIKNFYSTGFMGLYMKNSMEPKDGHIKSKMKTFKSLSQMQNATSAELVFQRFKERHQEFINLIEESRGVDLGKTKVTSLIGSLLRFKLGDCFSFLMAHNRRHLLQAMKILNQNKTVAA